MKLYYTRDHSLVKAAKDVRQCSSLLLPFLLDVWSDSLPPLLFPPVSSCCGCYPDIKCLVRISHGIQHSSRVSVDVIDVKWSVVRRPTMLPLCRCRHIFLQVSPQCWRRHDVFVIYIAVACTTPLSATRHGVCRERLTTKAASCWRLKLRS